MMIYNHLMSTHTARSRRNTRENNLWRRAPRWLRWVIGGFAVLLLVDAVVLGNWLLGEGGPGEIGLFAEKPQKIYLPLMVSNPTTDPMLARKPTATAEFQLEEYEIQYGDTLYEIAMAHEISLNLLLAANPGLERSTILHPGDIILIPPEDMDMGDFPPTPTPTRKPTKTPTPVQGAAETGAPSTQSAALDTTPTKNPPLPLAERVSEINGVPIEKIIVLPPEVVDNIRKVFAAGQEKGRNAQAFAKIGDSTIKSPFFMDRFELWTL